MGPANGVHKSYAGKIRDREVTTIAGDWIPIRKDLSRCNEVCAIMEATGLSRREVVGSLVDFWSWVDSETSTGLVSGCTPYRVQIVSDLNGTFVQTLSEIGWIRFTSAGLEITNFEAWFSKTAKQRLQDSRRKRMERSAENGDKAAGKPRKARKPKDLARPEVVRTNPDICPDLPDDPSRKTRTIEEESTEENIYPSRTADEPPKRQRKPDPLYESFAAAYREKFGGNYQSRKHDFIQLAEMKKKQTELTQDSWDKAVGNYLASPGRTSLADLAANYPVFLSMTLDRYNKPIQTDTAAPDGPRKFALPPGM